MRSAIAATLVCALLAGCAPRIPKEDKEAAAERWEANAKRDFTGEPMPDFALPGQMAAGGGAI